VFSLADLISSRDNIYKSQCFALKKGIHPNYTNLNGTQSLSEFIRNRDEKETKMGK
jgi:hypothetical protein